MVFILRAGDQIDVFPGGAIRRVIVVGGTRGRSGGGEPVLENRNHSLGLALYLGSSPPSHCPQRGLLRGLLRQGGIALKSHKSWSPPAKLSIINPGAYTGGWGWGERVGSLSESPHDGVYNVS